MGSNFNPAQYEHKYIMAPMVKIGTLPARLMCLRNGADLVYTEEIIDWKILKAKRVVNHELGTVDFIDESEDVIVFRTCDEEKAKVILQMGTSDPERALRVAKSVENDVAGIDVNMGCPKDFSLKGGMGAALLRQPEKIKAILTNLVQNVSIPVTCKIRVLESLEETLTLVKMIESCGVSALAVHGRTKDERQQHRNRNEYLKAIAETLRIPVMANGGSRDIERYEDIEAFRKSTGCSSVMLARAAEWNPSIFRKDGKLELQQLIKEYLTLAVRYRNPFPNTKYNIQNMLRELQETPLGKKFLASNVMEDLCELWDVKITSLDQKPLLDNRLLLTATVSPTFHEQNEKSKFQEIESSNGTKRVKLDSEDVDSSEADVTIVPGCVFVRGQYSDVNELPKSIVLRWYVKNGFKNSPAYSTVSADKKFRSVVDIGGQKFRTDVWEKNKRHAEQAAALAFLKYMKL